LSSIFIGSSRFGANSTFALSILVINRVKVNY